MTKFKLLSAVLNLFDGADGGSAGDTVGSQALPGSDRRDGNGASDAASAPGKAETGGSPSVGRDDSSPKGRAGDNAAPVAGEQKKETKVSEKERRAEFRRLVEGDYKDIYEGEFQKALDRRFRGARETEEKLSRVTPLIEALAARYDVESGDIGALQEAINKDRGYWESAAEEAGMTVEQYQDFLRYKSDSRRLSEMRAERERQADVQRRIEAWNNAAREVREAYPDFDIDTMAENAEFMSMLRAGVPMKHAYEVLNLSGIKALAAKEAAAATEKNVVDGIRAKGARPKENGTSSQSGITTGTDISKLSLKEIRRINERARSGEVITFR